MEVTGGVAGVLEGCGGFGAFPAPHRVAGETAPDETVAFFARLRVAAVRVMDWKAAVPGVPGGGMGIYALSATPGPHPTELGISDGATGLLQHRHSPLWQQQVQIFQPRHPAGHDFIIA